MANIQQHVFDNYRNIINTNAFTKEHTLNNVLKPPTSIMNLINSMMRDPEIDLGKVIAVHFRMLLNNRIGTLLKKDAEVPNIRQITGQFKPGELAIQVIEEDLYKWCLVIGPKPNGIIEIITRTEPTSEDFINKDVRIETLKQYSSSEKIIQNFTGEDSNLSEEKLLETYVISKENIPAKKIP